MFRRAQAAYPIDLWWSWTPEGYIWQDGSRSPVGAMRGAPVVASSCPFGKDTSRYGGVAGQWQNSWVMNATAAGAPAAAGGGAFSLMLAHPSPSHAGQWCLRPCAAGACKAGDFPAAAPCATAVAETSAGRWLFDAAQLRSVRSHGQ